MHRRSHFSRVTGEKRTRILTAEAGGNLGLALVEAFDGPRVLFEHRSSMHVQITHGHPRFSPDGRSALFTSDASGYGSICLVDVPDFGSLPVVD